MVLPMFVTCVYTCFRMLAYNLCVLLMFATCALLLLFYTCVCLLVFHYAMHSTIHQLHSTLLVDSFHSLHTWTELFPFVHFAWLNQFSLLLLYSTLLLLHNTPFPCIILMHCILLSFFSLYFLPITSLY